MPNTVCCAKSQWKSSLILVFCLKQIVVEDLSVGGALQGNTRNHKLKEKGIESRKGERAVSVSR